MLKLVNLDCKIFINDQNNGWSVDMSGQILPFVGSEFSVIIEMSGHFSLEQLEKYLFEMLGSITNSTNNISLLMIT